MAVCEKPAVDQEESFIEFLIDRLSFNFFDHHCFSISFFVVIEKYDDNEMQHAQLEI